ncbi:Nodulation protein H [Cryomorphaceae bacterium]|nr:Nodulation protein H [Cryomorphaceae bacterium]
MSLKRLLFESKKWLSIHVAGYVLQAKDSIKAALKGRKVEAKFVLFGKGRSGTTLLVSLMNSHPDLFCDGEILNKKVLQTKNRVRTRERLSPKAVYGFKLLSYQLRDLQDLPDPKAFLQALIDDGYKLIHLRRENNLRQVLSRLYAEHRMTYHAAKGSQNAPLEKMHLDVDDLLVQLGRSASLDRFEAEVLEGLDFLYVSYEKDLEDNTKHPETMRRVFSFLELDYHEPEAALKKITTKKLSGFIANADEVEHALRDSGYQSFLD